MQTAVDRLMNSSELINKSGSSWRTSLKNSGVKVIALYFSAHWCPPCRQFTPILKSAYEDYKSSHSSNNKLSVVFVSGDRSQDEMLSYMREAHGDWPGVPPGSP